MRLKAVFLSFLGVFVLTLVLSMSLWGDIKGRGHNFSGRCDFCHLSFPKGGKAGRFSRDISHLCRDCHNLSAQNSHPIGMTPSMQMPPGFALDWGGKMTCATCHDPHAKNSAKNLNFMRTSARGKEFCDLCHRGSLPIGGGVHVGAGGIAHSKAGIINDKNSFNQVLDKISIECLGCHDGVIASDASYRVAGGDALTYRRSGLSHPVGMDYRKAAQQDKELRPVEMLSPLISLYEGKVGCASCHNPYSRERRMLIFSNAGSALCRECHSK